MQMNYDMQTTLRSKAGGLTSLALLALGLMSQAHGAGLFFLKDDGKTNQFTNKLTVPVVTNAFEAKVFVVNRFAQTFTVERGGSLHLFRVDDGTELYNAKGKRTTLDWITAGQTVHVKVQERPSGRLDLLVANVIPEVKAQVAAGKRKRATPEPVVFPSEDARPSLAPETPATTEEPVVPVPSEELTPTPTAEPESTPAEPQPETPEPQTDGEPK